MNKTDKRRNNRYLALSLGLLALLASGPTRAADTLVETLQSATESGDLAEIGRVLDMMASAKTENQQEEGGQPQASMQGVGDIVLKLLRAGQGMMFDYAALAARLFELALQNWESLNDAQKQEALQVATQILEKVKDPSFQQAHPEATAQILGSALQLAGKVKPEDAPALIETLMEAAQSFAVLNPNDPTAQKLAEDASKLRQPIDEEDELDEVSPD